jgi:hypothetical protein
MNDTNRPALNRREVEMLQMIEAGNISTRTAYRLDFWAYKALSLKGLIDSVAHHYSGNEVLRCWTARPSRFG